MFKLNFQARDSGIWWGTLGKLQLMLRKASQALYVNEQFNLEEMHNYRRGQITSRLLSALIETKQKNTCLEFPKWVLEVNLLTIWFI